MDPITEESVFDVVVLGAGISGIIAAKRYLEAHPSCRIAILEKEDSVGGVFNRRRIYENFYTQWTFGFAEYSDLPMEKPPKEDCLNDCYKAKHMTEYLEKYAKQKVLQANGTIYDRITFSFHVTSLTKQEGLWHLSGRLADNRDHLYRAHKVMVAAGQTSLPLIPDIPGREEFHGPVIHSEDFGQSAILHDQTIEHLAVIGGGKSSADMVYEALKSGKQVSLIIRRSGTGPGYFAPVDLPTPYYRNGFEAASTRIMATLQPSILNPETLWTRFLHGTRLGIWLVRTLFGSLDHQVRKRANYHGRTSVKGFEKLQYDTPIFWQNNTGGVLHHSDFWDLVAEHVTVYREDIAKVVDRRVHLLDGTDFACDAILCGTGWLPPLELFHESLRVELDIPHQKANEPTETATKWSNLVMKADEEILEKFPILQHPPQHQHMHANRTPYRLYNTMLPVNDHSILFLNQISAGNKFIVAEAQALWAVAFLDGKVTLPKPDDMEKEIAAWIAWSRRRYLSKGELGDYAPFESITYTDQLLRGMGATAHLKGWWKGTFEPFTPADLGKAWRGYLQTHRQAQGVPVV